MSFLVTKDVTIHVTGIRKSNADSAYTLRILPIICRFCLQFADFACNCGFHDSAILLCTYIIVRL